jgi:hypothetical protein
MALEEAITSQIRSAIGSDPGARGIVGYSEDELEPPEGGASGIRIYVEEESVEVPATIADMPVHRVVVGKVVNKKVGVKVDPTTKVRPLIGGLSISSSGSGTLGYFVKREGKLCLLSAAHVLGKTDTKVIQPSFRYGGKPSDKVAELVDWQMLPDDGVDAACAELVETEASLELNELGKVAGVAEATKAKAQKVGKNEPYVTTGTIIDLKATWLNAPEGTFKDMILVEAGSEPFSQGGDSGSLVVQDMNAVGLLKGGSDTHDYVCHIGNVLKKLNATLAT